MESTIKVVIFHAGWLRCMRNSWAESFALSPVLWQGESYLCFLSFHFCFCKMRPIHIINSNSVSRERWNRVWIMVRLSPETLYDSSYPENLHSHNVLKCHTKLFSLTLSYFSIFTVHHLISWTCNPACHSNITFTLFSMFICLLFLLPGMVSSLSLPKFYSFNKTQSVQMHLLNKLLINSSNWTSFADEQ